MNDVIMKLAEQLGIAVEQIATIFAGSIHTIGLIRAIFVIVWLLTVIITAFVVANFARKNHYNENDDGSTRLNDDGWGITIVWTMIVGAIMVFVVHMIYVSVCNFFCPEYFAIKEMLSMVGV